MIWMYSTRANYSANMEKKKFLCKMQDDSLSKKKVVESQHR